MQRGGRIVRPRHQANPAHNTPIPLASSTRDPLSNVAFVHSSVGMRRIVVFVFRLLVRGLKLSEGLLGGALFGFEL